MTPYLIIFSFPLILHFALFNSDKKQIIPFYLFLFLIIFYLIGFRGHVGGDWNRYVFLFYNISSQYSLYEFTNIKFKPEYLFNVLLWIFKYFTEDILYFQAAISGIMILNFFIFSFFQKRPFLAVLIAIPVGIFLITMGYIRQGAAFSFILLSILALDRNKLITSIIFFITSLGFHVSTIIFFPIFLFYTLRIEIRLIIYLIASFLFIYLIINLQSISFEAIINKLKFFPPLYDLAKQYILDADQTSYGVYYRIIPFFLSVVIYFIFLMKNINVIHKGIAEFFILFFILCVFLLLFDFTTAADRLALYSLAFQIVILANLDLLFNSKINKIIVNLLVMLTFLILLLFWLMNSNESKNHWRPFYMDFHYDKRYSTEEHEWYLFNTY